MALSEGKFVEVQIAPIYNERSKRPASFDIEYKIDGKRFEDNLTNY
ncbi:DNA/RNA non-specific endonuclease [Shouchella lehensis]|uniref:Type VII secretion system protein EssD-like domain-containing protein n=1 Tax=Shouchella lehensis TaxID=300825 RepID=A0A4Y7WN11_9BACI|nr:hypothetical protein E2L03_09005 [Shouchella lehensis]